MKWLPSVLAVGVLALYALFLAEPINLVTADLGRHLKNGELWWQHRDVLFTNFYSYTEPTHPFINHHWGSGVVFFLAWKLLGFEGAQLFFIGLNLLAFSIMFRCAQERAGSGVAALLSILVIPLLAIRTEVRPEAFSYLFAAIFFQRLTSSRDQPPSLRQLWWLPVLEAVWVNLHSYFIMGPLLVAIFLIEALSNPARRTHARTLTILLGLTLAATLLNPFGVRGAFVPLTMFREYGYRLVENQSVPFLLARFAMPRLWLFIGIFVVLVFSMAAAWRVRRLVLSEVLIAVVSSLMGWLAYRNLALFGLLAIPLMASGIGALLETRRQRVEQPVRFIAGALLLFLFIGPPTIWSPTPVASRGLGLEKGDGAAAEFVKRQKIQGPIFNNYDIGSYVIFHLFPEHRVFVDNRPEAYSAAFFQETYVPMQEDAARWRQIDAQYGFNAILFHRHDLTPWGQLFLIARVDDPVWAPVFVDKDTIIFLKRNERNQSTIDRYQLPRNMFQAVPTTPQKS